MEGEEEEEERERRGEREEVKEEEGEELASFPGPKRRRNAQGCWQRR